jgi:transposase
MSTQGSEWFGEDVRVRAVELVCVEGWSAARVAQFIGCSVRSVYLWVRKSRQGRRPAALKTRTAPGAASKLNRREQQRLLKLLSAGPEAAGFAGQLWTGRRVAELIQREFGVTYNVRYLPTLLRSLGWSVQKPRRRAAERNEQAIADWVATDWPRIKKRPDASGPPSRSSTKRGS